MCISQITPDIIKQIHHLSLGNLEQAVSLMHEDDIDEVITGIAKNKRPDNNMRLIGNITEMNDLS